MNGKCFSLVIDDPKYPDDYMENFYCSERKQAEVPKETAVTVVNPDHPTYRIPQNLVCKQNSDRIVGGVDAIAHSWPWIVNLQFGAFICAGTLVDDETVISAAHCCDGFHRRNVQTFF